MTSPLLWFANRGTGVVLLALLTVTLLIGILSSRPGRESRWWPRFATQEVHRYLALLTILLLAAHVATAVLDEYVDIRWWHALAPIGGTYRPVFLGLGALSLDLIVALALTSLVRHRMPGRAWRAVHLLSYAAWLAAVVHTWGIGTDVGTVWLRAEVAASVGVVAAATTARVLGVHVRRRPVTAGHAQLRRGTT
jgi:sulfoxide reductase heme-binding subunit YedZ